MEKLKRLSRYLSDRFGSDTLVYYGLLLGVAAAWWAVVLTLEYQNRLERDTDKTATIDLRDQPGAPDLESIPD